LGRAVGKIRHVAKVYRSGEAARKAATPQRFAPTIEKFKREIKPSAN